MWMWRTHKYPRTQVLGIRYGRGCAPRCPTLLSHTLRLSLLMMIERTATCRSVTGTSRSQPKYQDQLQCQLLMSLCSGADPQGSVMGLMLFNEQRT